VKESQSWEGPREISFDERHGRLAIAALFWGRGLDRGEGPRGQSLQLLLLLKQSDSFGFLCQVFCDVDKTRVLMLFDLPRGQERERERERERGRERDRERQRERARQRERERRERQERKVKSSSRPVGSCRS
jgi:hypothetical protein